MKDFIFYGRFANVPIDKRFVVLDMIHHGDLTLMKIYTKIKAIDDKIRDDLIEKKKLLEIAEKYL